MNIKIKTQNVHLYYGDFHALKDISVGMYEKAVTALIGPSGCGKSTFLRLFNRMNDLIDNVKITGEITIDQKNIYQIKQSHIDNLRRNVGMVFQKPNPFPKTIFENVAYGLRVNGINQEKVISDQVELSLRQAALWEEVKDKLKKSAFELSGGQQQRLCIARALAVEPSILLMDEPASALDPISTAKIEELIFELKKDYTILIVTHNMQQAGRISDYTGFFLNGELIEFDETKTIFTNPKNNKTESYITGRFG
ncbi:MAG: phosphate ABC transporter ATP-binding protein [Saprospiraceae bacterium]|nr:phosphate ABC transporter ATP-binding protein [Saprospiraceae bacterium]MBK9631530.1 phosphate ABC transporter ATP-binding protein [Saprospiraceae bacterium]